MLSRSIVWLGGGEVVALTGVVGKEQDVSVLRVEGYMAFEVSLDGHLN